MSVAGYAWDEGKRTANLAKHGVDFADIARLDWSLSIIVRDARRDYGEHRINVYGPIDGRLHVCSAVPRGEQLRLISLRKANAREIRAWRARMERE